MQTIELLYPAVIPVGHRVEIRWYEAPVGGFWGSKPVVVDHEPLVRDLDTGVVYAPGWLFAESTGVRPNRAQEVRREPRTDAREVRALTGTVKSCRVLAWNGGDGSCLLQTTLTIDPA